MKWLFSAYKTTQRFLNSQRYHLHGGSRRLSIHASNPIGWSKPDSIRSWSIYSCHYYCTSIIVDAAEFSNRLPSSSYKIEHDVNKVDLEIISRETIKPSSPTPHHLRTYNFSIMDQITYDIYNPAVFFIPNINKDSLADVVTKRSKHLKEALSEILTRFYPLAGKVRDNLHIECNDEGIFYTEARVNQTLQEFLDHPDDERVRRLMPEKPCTAQSSIGNYVIGIQVNIFNCGGIGLSSSTSHRIFDGHSFFVFMKAWATTAKGLTGSVSPSFVASEIFPNINPCLECPPPSKLLATKRLSTKRFVFDSTALAMLKAQVVTNASSTHPPTRTEATTAVIWKAAAHAASKVRPFGRQSPHVLISAVNIRKRASPPLGKESIGNLIDGACAMCFPHGHLDLPTLMGELRESIAKINSNRIESMKGKKGHEIFNEMFRGLNQLMDVIAEGDCMMASSMLNNGMYELDFGWGKPIWFYMMNAGLNRSVALNDTLNSGGVEAIVTLSPDEMEIFEHDSELLSYATVNSSPIQPVY